MTAELWANLSSWGSLDTWIVVTAALAAMACALPGTFLVLRQQSMMGDALSHTVLPGIVLAFLLVHAMADQGWISGATYGTAFRAAMFAGALILGVAAAVLTEWIRRVGRVEAGAALGVVFTSFFALGLLLIRLFADDVHLDAQCVVDGTLVNVAMERIGRSEVPVAAVTSGLVLVVNLALTIVFFKELRICAFDPALASSLGLNANLVNYALMGVTAVTAVAVFKIVGSILVIAMLIVPPAAAHLLTDRLWKMIGLSLIIGGLSAVLGHAAAISLPSILFSRLGVDTVTDVETPGMMAVAGGCLFAAAALLGPRHGLLVRFLRHSALRMRIACEDLLGRLYRVEEAATLRALESGAPVPVARKSHGGGMLRRLGVVLLLVQGKVRMQSGGMKLTERGRQAAQRLVRAHRLWESYMAKYHATADVHLHDTAERVEHFIDSDLRSRLTAELEQPAVDPHGRAIPGEEDDPDASLR